MATRLILDIRLHHTSPDGFQNANASIFGVLLFSLGINMSMSFTYAYTYNPVFLGFQCMVSLLAQGSRKSKLTVLKQNGRTDSG